MLAAAIFAVLSVGSAAASASASYSATDVTTCNGTSTVTVRIDAQNPPPTLQAADIVLLVDDSGSIGASVFDGTVRPTLDSFVASASPSLTGNRIGIIEFSTNARNVSGGLQSSTPILQNIIDTMAYSSGSTFTLTGLQAASAMLTGVGSRPTAPKVIIVETDGVWTITSPSQDPTAYAAGLRAGGTNIFAVGVGSGVNNAQLQAIAGGDGTHVFPASDYAHLETALHNALLHVVAAATNLSYTATALPDWTIVGASATAGTISHTPTNVSWSLPAINSATPTSVTITYTLQHTGSTDGPAIPQTSSTYLRFVSDAGVSTAIDYSGRPVSVTGCNHPPIANAGTDQTVPLNGSHVAHVQLDGSASSDPDGDSLTYTWTAADALGPIASVSQPTVDLGIGTHTVHLSVSDGFYSAGADVTITVVDPSPPVVTANVVGPSHNGWYTTNAVVSFTVADPESDIASASPDCAGTTVAADTAGQTFTCTATSAGPGVGSATAFVKRDGTGPVVTFGGNAGTYGVADTVAITCTASDALSGLVGSTNCGGVSGPAWSFGAGPHTISRTATDVAGNATTQTATFTVAVDAAGLCALIQQWSDNAGVAHSLCVKLDHNNMRPFWNELAAQRGTHIPADKADIIRALSLGL